MKYVVFTILNGFITETLEFCFDESDASSRTDYYRAQGYENVMWSSKYLYKVSIDYSPKISL